MKQLGIYFLIAFLLFINAVAMCAQTTQDEGLDGGLTWKLSDSVLTVSGVGEMRDYTKRPVKPWTERAFTKVLVDSGVTNIGVEAFAYSMELKTVEIANSVTKVEEKAFFLCPVLEAVVIPERVTSIGTRAFDSCEGLQSVTIPASVRRIDLLAFGSCINLRMVRVLAANPPECDETAFFGNFEKNSSIPNDCVLYVPEGSVARYKSAKGWAGFTDIRE